MKNRSLLLLLFLLGISGVYGQTKEILLLDAATKQPIPDVNIFNPETLEGFISNPEGRVKIRFGTSSLFSSHIGYETIELLPVKDFRSDTIYLIPKAFELEEVVLHNVDLRKKLEYVLENYRSLYDLSAKTFDCTYKERLVVNGALTRLAQVQLKWWNRNYELDFGKSFYKQNQFSLTTTDYSKVVTKEQVLATSGFIDNVFLIQYIHLNYYPILLTTRGKDFHIKAVEKHGGDTMIVFDGILELDGESSSLLEDSRIYFENNTGAITKVELRMKYQNNVKIGVSREKEIPYTSTMKMHHLDLAFSKLPSGKWVPAFFHSILTAELEAEGKKEEVEVQQSMYFTKTGENRKIDRRDRIDLSKPFYTNFPTDKESPTKILLTKEEEAFMGL